MTAETATASADLRREVDELMWYHTLELAPGVETPGWFDLRSLASEVPMPASLEGKRCLDVGTFDGFWAFEMERRGASEVLGVDIIDPTKWDWPAGSEDDIVEMIARRKAEGQGFEIAKRELGSEVERRELSVYDLDPDDVGTFDVVYLGSLLLHLRDPVRALESVRSVCDETLVLIDAVNLLHSRLHRWVPMATLDGRGRPWWWKPNMAGLARMVEVAGFELSEPPRLVYMKPGRGHPRPKPTPRYLLSRNGREEFMRALRGDPHGAIVAHPKFR